MMRKDFWKRCAFSLEWKRVMEEINGESGDDGAGRPR